MKNFVIAVLSVFSFPVFAFALANPASVKCIQDGGSLEVETDFTGNQYEACTFPSGLECEEWAYYKGECSEKTFSDITNSIFAEDIQSIKDAGIVSGYSDGTFKPDNTINRAEFTKIIIGSIFFQSELAECDLSQYGFSDVSTDNWFAPYVCLAKKEGIINGYTDGTFKAGNEITLPEALKIILLVNKKEVATPSCYMDECEPWYYPYLFKATEIFNDNKAEVISRIMMGSVTYEQLGVVSYKVTRGEMAYFINTLKNPSSDNSVSEGNSSSIPTDCASWFDGCNTCSVENGVLGGCTKMACIRAETPYCKLYKDSVAPKDPDPLAGQVMVTPLYTNIPKNCTSWFDGCNTCSAKNGEVLACTLMACYSKEGLPTKTPQCMSY